jgi:hypothetical protein
MRVSVALLLLTTACGPWFRYARPTHPRTFDPEVACADAGRLLVTFHGATHRAKGERPPVVLFEPLAVSRALLDRGADGGLVPYLNYRGFPVWVVFAEAPAGVTTRALGACFAQAVVAIARVTHAPRVDVGGVSLGGQVAAHALASLGDVALDRVFFYAAGLDYAYPGSFLDALADRRGAPLADACGGCARWLAGAGPADLGVLPPRGADEALPLAERFPGVPAARAPALFVNGKIDGLAPSESVYPVYQLYGRDGGAPRRLVIVGRDNFLDDLDHWGMLSGAHEDGFEVLGDWLTGD